MNDMTKRVVILNNFQSKYIYQAIIVLKDYDPDMEEGIIREAEKIVNNYLEKNRPAKTQIKKKKKRNIKAMIPICTALALIAGLVIAAVKMSF